MNSGMGVGIDEAGQHDLAFAVDLDDCLAILLQPGIAEGVFAFADGDNLSAEAEHGAVFDDAKFFEFWPAPRAGVAGAECSVRSWPMLISNRAGCCSRDFLDRFKLLV